MKKISTIVSTILQKKGLKKIISNIVIFGFFLFIIIYGISKTRLISQGVNLSVEGIENGKLYETGILEIKGNALRAKHLLINGRELNINQEGDFLDSLVLSPGYNIITISAEDKFGKVTKKVYEVMRKEN